jgi:hypothetical protein
MTIPMPTGAARKILDSLFSFSRRTSGQELSRGDERTLSGILRTPHLLLQDTLFFLKK